MVGCLEHEKVTIKDSESVTKTVFEYYVLTTSKVTQTSWPLPPLECDFARHVFQFMRMNTKSDQQTYEREVADFLALFDSKESAAAMWYLFTKGILGAEECHMVHIRVATEDFLSTDLVVIDSVPDSASMTSYHVLTGPLGKINEFLDKAVSVVSMQTAVTVQGSDAVDLRKQCDDRYASRSLALHPVSVFSLTDKIRRSTLTHNHLKYTCQEASAYRSR